MEAERKRGPGVWIAIGCGIAFIGLISFVVFILFVVFGSIRQSTPYRDSVARAQNDPRVRAVLGTPIKPGFFFSGSINTQNRDGDAKLDIPLSGPKGKATLRVVATKTRGRWSYEQMIVTPQRGAEINLLNEELKSTAPPGE